MGRRTTQRKKNCIFYLTGCEIARVFLLPPVHKKSSWQLEYDFSTLFEAMDEADRSDQGKAWPFEEDPVLTAPGSSK